MSKNKTVYGMDWVCAVEGCSSPGVINSKGGYRYEFCLKHRPDPGPQPLRSAPVGEREQDKTCKYDGCDNKRQARGFCHGCYQKFVYNNPEGFTRKGRTMCGAFECDDWASAGKGRCSKHKNLERVGWTAVLQATVFDLQDGVCANEGCQKPLTMEKGGLASDHDHVTGEPRALLCTHCNTALGMMNEDVERIAGLLRYAEQCENARAWWG